MITLKLEDVKAAARKAYAEGRLSAQAPEPVCEYRSVQEGKTYACGIGAALTDEQAAELLAPGDDFNICSLAELASRWTSDRKDELVKIQDAHDEWVGTIRRKYTPALINSTRDYFLQLIAE